MTKGKKAAPELREVFSIRLLAAELAAIREAAAPYPAATWARIALARAAAKELAERKKGGR